MAPPPRSLGTASMGIPARADDGPRIETRAAVPEDLAFVFSTWLNNFHHSSRFAKRINRRVFFAAHHLVIERLLARGAEVTIAHPPGDPGVIVGYLCVEHVPEGFGVAGVEVPETVLHFAYTKGPFRRMGVMRTLLGAARVDLNACAFTHLTDDGEALWNRFPGAVHVPYLST